MNIIWMQNSEEIIVSPTTVKILKLIDSKIILKVGAFRKELSLKIDDQFQDQCLGLPSNFSEDMKIPTDIHYNISVQGDVISIGPVIGMIISEKYTNLTKLQRFVSRFRDYQAIGGLIYLFTEAGVNRRNKSIKGYYYHPSTKTNEGHWSKGIFPYPDVLYKRKPMKKRLYEDFKRVIGQERIFNSYHFNKWELWRLLPAQSPAKQLLPYTERFSSIQQLENMLRQFEFVYLKPQRGSGGNGIYRIQKKGKKFILKSYLNHELDVATIPELSDHIKLLTNRNYLIQQGIHASYHTSHVDFRAYLQKNEQKEWVVQLMIGRFSKSHQISTNLKFLDHLLIGSDAIQKYFQVNEEEAKSIEQTIQKEIIQLAKELDQYVGHYGDIAIDFTLDQHKKLWVFEVNTKTYGYVSFRKLKDKSLFYKCKTAPFKYAKALAGF